MNNNIYVYGDIIDGSGLVEQIQELNGADVINVYINTMGGSCQEGIAIINALRRTGATINTYNTSFACSMGATILLSGDNKYMYDNSLTMIHNCWSMACGNANELRKQADDLDKINQSILNIYKQATTLDEATLIQMMNDETWLTAEECEDYFGVNIISNKNESKAVASVKDKVIEAILQEKERVQKSYIENFINSLK